MVHHCVDEYDPEITVKRVQVSQDNQGYRLKIYIHIPMGIKVQGNLHGLQNFIIENLEKFAGIVIFQAHIIIDHFIK